TAATIWTALRSPEGGSLVFAAFVSAFNRFPLLSEIHRSQHGQQSRVDANHGGGLSTSPLVFCTVNERSILRLLKLIACDNGKIGTYTKLVDDRNETAHPNGNIFFSTQAALDAKITEILRVVDEIQTYSMPVIEHAYCEFLLQNHDPEEREYPDAADQLREVLIHGNYLSQKDIDICLGFDVASLADQPEIESICTLHEALTSEYGQDDDRGGKEGSGLEPSLFSR
ncbi:MAG TPA: hypothetical protein VJ733_06120, partial [Candidatus Binatia bacterium]|nr:hypothetical protein [Candidatus Binatia bacterium]